MTSPLETAAYLKGRLGPRQPKVGLVLGSGLGPLADLVEDACAVPFAEIAGFRMASVAGHAGRLVAGRLGGVDVACLQGRVHAYEGASAEEIRHPVRTLKALGCDRLILTNAAGSLDPAHDEGTLVAIRDHINWAGISPLAGPNDEDWGPRFFPMTDAYDPAMRAALAAAAARQGIALPEGVYAWYPGPNFETPAEIRALRILGADLVGMSTVPEVLVARHCGLRVAAISAVTNLAAGMRPGQHLSHDHTQAVAARIGRAMSALLVAALPEIAAA
ncbi:MAG: purine-nucleoside phosphorylase [Rhodospirillales bacterium]|nr:purine-nucleoside phosphorylase [Rhodospirillales bacterium]